MLTIKKRYVMDEEGNPVAVQIDLETFQKIEELLEDYVLAREIQAVEGEESLDLHTAQERHKQTSKKK